LIGNITLESSTLQSGFRRQTGEIVTQEFHISVTPVGQNDYLVRTEQVAPGVPLAEELVTWPVSEWLGAAGYLMNDPLQSVLQGDVIARNSINLVVLGQQLYNALFQSTLRDSWITAQGIAQNQQQVLRLRLGLKDTRLARLPWEVMHAGDRPLATGPYIAFSRYQSGIPSTSRLSGRNIPTLQEESGVKVLMIISSPIDHVRLDLLKQEAINLQAELYRQPSRFGVNGKHSPEIELTVLDQPGREELTQALEQGRFHILHYSGHSNLGANGGEIYLVSKRTGLTETLSGDDLAGLLVNNNIIMGVFNSCLGAYRAKSDHCGETGERNLTESLVKRGIRSVLAMSERIPDEVALTLTQLFYRNLSQGYPLDLCVSRVRQGLISAYGSHQMYWALPILYVQRDFDGFLLPETDPAISEPFLNDYPSPMGITNHAQISPTTDDYLHMPLVSFDDMPSGTAESVMGSGWLGDTWGEYEDEMDDDPTSYANDSAVVTDVFSQLGNSSLIGEESTFLGEMWQQGRGNNGFNQNSHPQFLENPNTDIQEELDFWSQMPTQISSPSEGGAPNATNHSRMRLEPSFSLPTQRPLPHLQRWSLVGILGILAIAVVMGINFCRDDHPVRNIAAIPPISPQNFTNSLPPSSQFQKSTIATLTTTAKEKLHQGDLQIGLKAVEELCNRHAWSVAADALALIPNQQTADPQANFIRGRLAWQQYRMGDKKYTPDYVRRVWQVAVQGQPESVLYNNALGFAYYETGDLNSANDAWFKALNLAHKLDNSPTTTANSSQIVTPSDTLTAYAGLGLALYKSAHDQPTNKRKLYINEAIRLRQIVMGNEAENFTVNKLGDNWLWTSLAIGDWQSLLEEKSSN